MKTQVCFNCTHGFSLIEMMIALSTIAFGFLAASQLLYIASASSSLARAKSTAALSAQDTIEFLGAIYRQTPSAPELALGEHGPRIIEVKNPTNGVILNRYSVSWMVDSVYDPRPGKTLQARSIRTTVTPVTGDGRTNNRAGLNKTLNVSTVFSQEIL